MPTVERGEIWWANLTEPRGSEPGYRRPVLIVQSDRFNQSRIQTIVVAVISTNLSLADAPGNVFLPASTSGLPKDSVINVSQLLAIDRVALTETAGAVGARIQASVDAGLRLLLDLS